MKGKKISRYIETVQMDDGELYIFSLRTAKFVRLSKEEHENLFQKKGENIAKELWDRLVEKKILVDDAEDELQMLSATNEATMYEFEHGKTTHFVLTPTMECNARCYYCFEHGAHHQTMSLEMADSVADFILQKSGDEPISIYWYGGEPLMGTEIIDHICRRFRQANKQFSSRITTNGYYLNDKNVHKAIHDWNVEMIQVPLDGIGAEYNKIKNYKQPCVDDPFSLLMENIQRTLDNKLCVRIRVNFHPKNMAKLEELFAYVKERFGENPYLMFHCKPIGGDNIPWMSDLPWDGEENSLKKYYEIAQKYLRGGAPYPFKKTCVVCRSRPCVDKMGEAERILQAYELLPLPTNCIGATNRAMAIDSCGSLYTCHLMLGQDFEKYSSGTIFTDITRNAIYNHYHSTEIYDTCKNCKMMPVCQGGCKFRRKRYEGKENRCMYFKNHLNELLKFVLKEMKEKNISLE